jgi:hypothetical protein
MELQELQKKYNDDSFELMEMLFDNVNPKCSIETATIMSTKHYHLMKLLDSIKENTPLET